jgi:hypothetical protein
LHERLESFHVQRIAVAASCPKRRRYFRHFIIATSRAAAAAAVGGVTRGATAIAVAIAAVFRTFRIKNLQYDLIRKKTCQSKRSCH